MNFTKEEQIIENIFHRLNQCVDKTWLKHSVGVLAFGDPWKDLFNEWLQCKKQYPQTKS